MTADDSAADKPDVMVIDGEMTIYQAEQLKRDLLAALERTRALEIRLGGVTELDTAGVQLLMLVKETARVQGKQLRLVEHSEAVADVLDLIDLVPYFGDPLVIAPDTAHTGIAAGAPMRDRRDVEAAHAA